MTKFSFEKFEYTYDFSKSKEELITQLNLSKGLIGKRDQSLLEAVCDTNIRNIYYYKNKIWRETLWRYAYSAITLGLLIAIPFFIYYKTEGITGDLDLFDSTKSFIVTGLASVLAFHKLTSAWIEKRKFRSQFLQAKIDLCNMLFQFVEDHRWIDEENAVEKKHFATPEMREAMEVMIKKSRGVVDEETKKYFELSASPDFDISLALTNAATSATSLFSSFKSKKFEAEYNRLIEEDKEQQKEEAAKLKESAKNAIDFQVLNRKMQRLLKREAELDDQVEALESIEKPTEQQEKRLETLYTKLDALQLEIEETEDAFITLEVKAQHESLNA